jgi:hypothetical protein
MSETISEFEKSVPNRPKTVFEKRAEMFPRCRAYVLQAVNANPGMGYIEIRQWIQEHLRFTMENVGARVRELAREIQPSMVTIEYDRNGNAHVYPIKET